MTRSLSPDWMQVNQRGRVASLPVRVQRTPSVAVSLSILTFTLIFHLLSFGRFFPYLSISSFALPRRLDTVAIMGRNKNKISAYQIKPSTSLLVNRRFYLLFLENLPIIQQQEYRKSIQVRVAIDRHNRSKGEGGKYG